MHALAAIGVVILALILVALVVMFFDEIGQFVVMAGAMAGLLSCAVVVIFFFIVGLVFTVHGIATDNAGEAGFAALIAIVSGGILLFVISDILSDRSRRT